MSAPYNPTARAYMLSGMATRICDLLDDGRAEVAGDLLHRTTLQTTITRPELMAACSTEIKRRAKLRLYPHEILAAKATLSDGHAHDLKVEHDVEGVPTRWWLSRCAPADGETHRVYVEQLADGRWVGVYKYGSFGGGR